MIFMLHPIAVLPIMILLMLQLLMKKKKKVISPQMPLPMVPPQMSLPIVQQNIWRNVVAAVGFDLMPNVQKRLGTPIPTGRS